MFLPSKGETYPMCVRLLKKVVEAVETGVRKRLELEAGNDSALEI
jgi:hypothetical protein